MKICKIISTFFFFCSITIFAQDHLDPGQNQPTRQVHLDFHTSGLIPEIGKKFAKKQFQEMLVKGNINAINIFAKGHHGWSYYPTSIGKMHPNLDFDLLGAQIEACHEIGVKCPIYFTVGWSHQDALAHPEWTERNKDGSMVGGQAIWGDPDSPKPYTEWTLLNPSGEYHQQIMNQVEEICKRYDVDGFWFDIYILSSGGYSINNLHRMREMGMDMHDPAQVERSNAELVKEHMKEIRQLIAGYHPDATVFFNGTTNLKRSVNVRHHLYQYNTHQDLEDLPTTWGGYNKLPLHTKYYIAHGWPVTAMSGKFHKAWGEFGGFKDAFSLTYEASSMIAYGASCNFGDQLHPSGEMDPETYRLIGEAYKYVKQIEDYGPGATPVSKLGVWYTNDHIADEGITNILLDIHYDFLIAHAGNLDQFERLIIP